MEEVTREVELDSDPERVWHAISEESELGEWLGREVEIDLQPGGEISVTEGDGRREGFVESVEEGRSLSFWWSDGEAESSRVEIEVIDDPDRGGCLLRVTESTPLTGLERDLADITALAPA